MLWEKKHSLRTERWSNPAATVLREFAPSVVCKSGRLHCCQYALGCLPPLAHYACRVVSPLSADFRLAQLCDTKNPMNIPTEFTTVEVKNDQKTMRLTNANSQELVLKIAFH